MLIFVTLVAARPASAYRTAADLTAFAGSTQVNYPATPLRFRMVSDSLPGLNPLDLELAAKAAMATWNQPACVSPPLSFDGSTAALAEPGDNLNTIQWVQDWDARHLPAGAAGSTDVQYLKLGSGQWQIVEADIYLNANFAWSAAVDLPVGSDSADAPKDVQAVLTHELGHAVGLLHPCEPMATAEAPVCTAQYADECMNPIYSASQRVLSGDDIAGICFLYPSPNCDLSGCPDGESCSGGTCLANCGDTVCSDQEVCTAYGCVLKGSCTLSSCLGRTCEKDADCAFREYCSSSKVCAVGAAPLADPCMKSADCADGACASGSCASSCQRPEDCPAGADCDAAAGVCRDSLKALGEACAIPSECRGGECLVENMDVPVCTRACGDSLAHCPSGWMCRTADSKPVCAPEHAQPKGGCEVAFGGGRTRPRSASLLETLALTSLLIRRGRRRRIKMPHPHRES